MQIRPRRPRRLRLAFYLIVGLGCINLARAIVWQLQKAILMPLAPRLSPNFASGAAVAWAVFFAILGWLMWRNWPAIHLWLSIGLGAYGVYRLVIWRWWLVSPLTRRSEGLLLIGFAGVACYLIWAYNSRRARRYLAACRQPDQLTNPPSKLTFPNLTSD